MAMVVEGDINVEMPAIRLEMPKRAMVKAAADGMMEVVGDL